MLPSAFVNKECRLLIGPGVLINPKILIDEIEMLGCYEKVGVDPRSAIIESHHIEADKKGDLARKIKTTGSGTGPCNAERALRIVRLAREVKELKDFLVDEDQ